MSAVAIFYEFTKALVSNNYEEAINSLQEFIDSNEQPHGSCSSDNIGLLDANLLVKCPSFSLWVARQNVLACKYVMRHLSSAISGEDCQYNFHEQFYQEVVAIQGMMPSINHLSLGFLSTYNYLSTLLSTSQTVEKFSSEAWIIISVVLDATDAVSMGNIHLAKDPTIDGKDFLQNIINFDSFSLLSIELCSSFCLAVACLAALERKYTTFSKLAAAVKKMKKVAKQKVTLERRVKQLGVEKLSFWSMCDVPSIPDQHYFLTALENLNNKEFDLALNYIDRIKFHDWKYDLLYCKCCILYGTNQYDVALECSMSCWEEKAYITRKLVAKFCNIIGCCFYSKSKFSESQDWFNRCLEYDCEFSLPIWNLSLACRNLNQLLKVKDCLDTLVSKRSTISSRDWVTFDCLNLSEPQITYDEAVYLLAHHRLETGEYVAAGMEFSRLITHRRKNAHSIIYNRFSAILPSAEYKMYIEAAYVFLLAREFGKCSKVCALVDGMMPLIPVSDWNTNEIETNVNKNSSTDILGVNFPMQLRTFDTRHSEQQYFDVIKMHVVSCVLFHKEVYTPIVSILKKMGILCERLYRSKSDFSKRYMQQDAKDNAIVDHELGHPTKKFKSDRDSNNVANSHSSCESLSVNLHAIQERNMMSVLYNNLAVIFIACGQLENAKMNLQLAGENDPENLDVLFNSCLLEVKLGNEGTAQKMWFTAKQKLLLLRKLLNGSAQSHSYSVDLEDIKCLDSVIAEISMSDSDLKLDFDVTWDFDEDEFM